MQTSTTCGKKERKVTFIVGGGFSEKN